jgi:hypothetical protein
MVLLIDMVFLEIEDTTAPSGCPLGVHENWRPYLATADAMRGWLSDPELPLRGSNVNECNLNSPFMDALVSLDRDCNV